MTDESFRPKFTTSAKAQEEAREKRDDYFGKNVRSVEGPKPQKRVKEVPAPQMKLQPYPQKLPVANLLRRENKE